MFTPQRRFGILVILVCQLLLVACTRDPQVLKQRFYNKGLEYLKQGKLSEAKLQLMNALRIDQSFAEAASVLAEIHFREKDYRHAFALLQQAVDAKPGYLPAHKGLAQIYSLSGRLPEAQKQLEFILTRTPDDVETLINLGTIQASQRKLEDAEGSFKRVLERQPGHVGALLALAGVSREQKDLSATEHYLKVALDKNPRSAAVYLGLFKFYILTNRTAEMEPLFQQALKDTGNNLQILQAQDGFYEGAGRLAEAEAVVAKIQSLHAGEPAFWSATAEFYIRTNNWTKAKAELERILQQHKDDIDDLHKLIEVHLNMNGRKEAEALNNGVLQRNPLDSYAHVFKGRMAVEDGKLDLALLEFNSTLKLRPEWPALHFWLAQVYLRRREFQLARHELETALTYDPEYRTARIALASLQNRAGLANAALSSARLLLQANPRDVPALLVFGEALIYNKNYEAAEKVIHLALQLDPNSADVHRESGILQLARKNLAAARQEFRLAWNLEPHSKQYLQNVVFGYVIERQTNAAIQFLREAIETRHDDPLLYVELARMHVWTSHRGDAITDLQTAIKLAPDDLESSILLAEVFSNDNQADRAAELLETVVHKPSIDTELLVRAGTIFERLQRWPKAREAYERALQLDGTNAIAKNNLAWVLTEHSGDMNVALTLAQEAADKLTENADVASTLGWIYYKRQHYGLALKYLASSVKKQPNEATFQYELGMTLWKLERPNDALRSLQNALELDPHFSYAQSATETIALIRGASASRIH